MPLSPQALQRLRALTCSGLHLSCQHWSPLTEGKSRPAPRWGRMLCAQRPCTPPPTLSFLAGKPVMWRWHKSFPTALLPALTWDVKWEHTTCGPVFPSITAHHPCTAAKPHALCYGSLSSSTQSSSALWLD